MATSGLYGSSPTGVTVAAPGSETSGLYGNGTTFGGTYFEWFIFIQSATQPATPTGGSWSFTTNVGTPPSGWSLTPPSAPTLPVWGSIALVNSANSASLTWSAPGLFAYAQGLPVLSGADIPLSSDGVNSQLYIQTGSTPQTIWFKESGTWTRLTGSTLYVDLVNNQTIGGTKTFSSQIQGSISGTSSNVTGVVAIANGGTGQATATNALNALLPSQTGNTGKYLTTDGSNTSWQPTTGAGTVTSVNVSGGTTGLTTSGGPITAAGTITLAGTLAVTNGGTGSTSTTYANLASNVYGVLPVNNGGTGVTTSTGSGNNVLSTNASLTTPTQVTYENWTGISAPTYTEGRLWYDSAAHALAYYNDSANATVHIGQDLQVKVINNTGSTIANGAPVYITGTSSGQTYPNIALAKADVAATSSVIGLTNGSIANGAIGYVTSQGVIDGVNTGTFTVGQVLYLSPYSAGQLMNTIPPTGITVQVGVVSYVDASAGKIYVKQTTPLAVPASIITGQVAIANGGTGQTTANAAFNALAPSQTGNSGKYLTTDGTNTSWATNPLGTVTSVAATVPAFLSITGSPITTNGTLAFGLSGTALPTTSGGTGLTSFTANGVVYASSTSALTTGSALTFDGTKLVNTGYNKSSYQVSTGGVGTFESVGAAYLSYASGGNLYSMLNGSGTEDIFNYRASAHIYYIGGVEKARFDTSGNLNIVNLTASKVVFTDASKNLTSTGTVSVAQGGTGTSTPALVAGTNVTITGTWPNQTINSSNSGGTVTSVAATVPSFLSVSGSPITTSGTLAITYSGTALPTTSGGTGLSSFTANGVVYASSTSALTSGSALTFDGTSLSVPRISQSGSGTYGVLNSSGAGNAWMSYQYSGSEIGEIGQGSGIISGGSNTDFGIRATNNLVFGISYNEQMRLTSTGLGIGTSSPQARLNVVDASSANNGTIWLGSATYYGTVKHNASGTGANEYNVATSSGGGHQFQRGGTTLMDLNQNGNLGLGVAPSAWGSGQKAFQIGATGALYSPADRYLSLGSNFYDNGTNGIYLTTGYATIYQQNRTSGVHAWYTAPSGTAGNAITFTQAMTLDASGNLAVGTTNSAPANGTGMVVGAASTITRIDMRNSTTGLASGDGTSFYLNGNDFTIENRETGFVAFATSSTERARIDSSGNLLVGTTSASGKITVSTSGNTYGIFSENTNTATTSNYLFWGYASSASRFVVYGNGGIANYQANNVNLSDLREKTNFAPAKSYLDVICAIPVQTFNFIDQAENDVGLTLGVIAQDVQAVAPELVTENNWGTEEEPKMRLSIYQTDLQYALMKALQELKAEFDAYKASHP